MNIDELTLGQIKQLRGMLGDSAPQTKTLGLTVGDAVFIRAAVYHYTGRVTSIADGAVTLSDAAWIADSGKWNEALSTGVLDEIEPEPNGVTVPLDAVLDWRPWTHTLPSEPK